MVTEQFLGGSVSCSRPCQNSHILTVFPSFLVRASAGPSSPTYSKIGNRYCKGDRWTSVYRPPVTNICLSFPINYIVCPFSSCFGSEEVVGKDRYLPLLAYLEALPPWYQVHGDHIASNLSGDGSLFHSPSATAGAYMATGDVKCLAYLQSLTENFPNRGGIFECTPIYYTYTEN